TGVARGAGPAGPRRHGHRAPRGRLHRRPMAERPGVARVVRCPRGTLHGRGRGSLQPPRRSGDGGRTAYGAFPARGRHPRVLDAGRWIGRCCRRRSRPVTSTLGRRGLLALAALASMALSASFGASGLGPGDLVRSLAADADPAAKSILLQLRLPRTVLAALVGGALGLSGCTFQALLRNPLAEPYVLGISGGAAVGAVGIVVTGLGTRLPWTLPMGAFVGALVAMGLVLRIARRASRGSMDTRVLVLSGVIAGAFFNAVVLLLLSLADVESFRSA